MDVREKLVELLTNSPQLDVLDWTTGWEEAANYLIAHGVTVQNVPDNNVDKWISVNDRLPEMRDDGFADAFLVTNGSLAHIAYFVDGDWIFTDNGQMKEPMFYGVTHWLCLPKPSKGE